MVYVGVVSVTSLFLASFGPESDSLARFPGTQKRLQHIATVYPVVDHAAKLQTSANPLILNKI